MNNKVNKITKAELLWTRTCPLKCSYCNMATGEKNTLPLEYWEETVEQLKKLNCKFVAIYGAEPLADEGAINKLSLVINKLERSGINCTVITSGAVPNLREKLIRLYSAGLRSLTMSYDILPLDSSSKAKSDKAIETLLWFKSLDDGRAIRDVATVTTLTKWNYHLLPEHINKMTKLGIWTFFDLIHDDRNQPGGKCKHTAVTEELLFNEYHYKHLGEVLKAVAIQKEMGMLCNTSLPFIQLLEENDYEHIKNYNWHCAKDPVFPGWITIDYDGSVYPCDDFHTEKKFKSNKIAEEFDEFREFYRKEALDKCSGCLWNTHIDANFIKAGVLDGYGVEKAKKNI